MYIRAVPDELISVKRLAARPTCVQRQQKGRSVERPLTLLAEEVGFEPTEPFSSTVFKTAAFNHSAIPPFMFSVAQQHVNRSGYKDTI